VTSDSLVVLRAIDSDREGIAHLEEPSSREAGYPIGEQCHGNRFNGVQIDHAALQCCVVARLEHHL